MRQLVRAAVAVLALAPVAAGAQDIGERLQRAWDGLQGQQQAPDRRVDPRYDQRTDPRYDQRADPRYDPRVDPRSGSPAYDRSPEDRRYREGSGRSMTEADRRLEERQRQLDEEQRRLDAERRRMGR
ncbi:hypothetical protein JMJ55_05670 [Belnapia sp. T6]|uniref:Uncharacterized protein n=1 Tax=Belnapia mucosa TaxID=2804532 RepID=A0ABS1UZB0_9PROT|nr:hypothetical protein [Belnapia mucosa]MBL6454803.1 hypothetical protein [Belnapia mucosa]